MHILILDDKPKEISTLLEQLELCENVAQTTVCENLSDFLNHASKHSFDAAFVDVMMPEMNGFEMASTFLKNIPVVFISSDPINAVKAFDFQPVYFLSKPIDRLGVLRSLQKIKEKIEGTAINSIFITTGRNQITRIDYSEILFIKSENEYVGFKTTSLKVYLTLGSIKYWASTLLKFPFIQCHRSYIVNLANVRSVSSDFILMKNREEIPISERYKSEVKSAFQRAFKE